MYKPVKNFGHITVANGALIKFSQVIMTELKDKPVRINEVRAIVLFMLVHNCIMARCPTMLNSSNISGAPLSSPAS